MVYFYLYNFTSPSFLTYFYISLNLEKETHLDNTFCTIIFSFFLLLLTNWYFLLFYYIRKIPQASYLVVNTRLPLHGIEIQPLFEQLRAHCFVRPPISL